MIRSLSNLKQQGTESFIWDFFGKMATNGMGFIITIFLSRFQVPLNFGLIRMLMVIIGMVGVFTDIGLRPVLSGGDFEFDLE